MNPHSADRPPGPCRRPALMVAEALVALSLLLAALMIVAEVGTWSVAERQRNAARQLAQDEAENALELARARPWSELTADWAKAQQLSEAGGRLRDGTLELRVEVEPKRPGTKRVTALVTWKHDIHESHVEMVALVSSRSADVGGKP